MSADKQFDPEKVERYEPETYQDSTMRTGAYMGANPRGAWVQLSDYDQLLALYSSLRTQLSTSEVANGMQMEKYRL